MSCPDRFYHLVPLVSRKMAQPPWLWSSQFGEPNQAAKGQMPRLKTNGIEGPKCRDLIKPRSGRSKPTVLRGAQRFMVKPPTYPDPTPTEHVKLVPGFSPRASLHVSVTCIGALAARLFNNSQIDVANCAKTCPLCVCGDLREFSKSPMSPSNGS